MGNLNENQTFTQTQFFFIIGKKKLEKFEIISETRPLTFEENESRENVYLSLWSLIRKYAFKLITLIKTNTITPDLNSELHQALYQVFTEKLDIYDPRRTTPTTFFKPHFINVITKKLNGENISSYDIQNLKKVRSAINYFEGRGVDWTIDMISTKSGLSTKVVNQTLTFGNYTSNASDEALVYIQSSVPTPEEQYLNDERTREILNVIEYHIKNGDFTREEFNLFCLRNNGFDGSKVMPYQKIANQAGISLTEVRNIINKVLKVLQQDERLRKMYYNKENFKVNEGITLCFSL